jgi:hypothetical protein
MFKKGQVVAVREPFEDDPEFIKIAGILGKKVVPTNNENDPRIWYREDELRPLTREEIEGE